MRNRVVGSGRPLGPTALGVLDLLKSQSLSAREVAARLQLARSMAKYTCSRLESSGHIVVVDKAHVQGSHKKVRIYGAAPIQPPAKRVYQLGGWLV